MLLKRREIFHVFIDNIQDSLVSGMKSVGFYLNYDFPRRRREMFSVPVLLLFIGLMYGCTETIELELETSTRRLVVDGMVTSDQKMHYIRLTESVPFFHDTASPAISGAKIVLSDGMRAEQMTESTELPGFYLTSGNFDGIPERTYTITISGVDIDEDGEQETYSASSYMPVVSSPDSIDLLYDSGWDIWKILLYAGDPPETEDYYMFRVFKNGTLISDNISEFSVVSDRFFDGGRANGVWVQSIDASSRNEQLEDGDIITLQMCGITKEYYKFIEGVQRENRARFPLFSGPPANAPGNVSNDAMGFFPAFSASYVSYRFGSESN